MFKRGKLPIKEQELSQCAAQLSVLPKDKSKVVGFLEKAEMFMQRQRQRVIRVYTKFDTEAQEELQEGHLTKDGELQECTFTTDGELQGGNFNKGGSHYYVSYYYESCYYKSYYYYRS